MWPKCPGVSPNWSKLCPHGVQIGPCGTESAHCSSACALWCSLSRLGVLPVRRYSTRAWLLPCLEGMETMPLWCSDQSGVVCAPDVSSWRVRVGASVSPCAWLGFCVVVCRASSWHVVLSGISASHDSCGTFLPRMFWGCAARSAAFANSCCGTPAPGSLESFRLLCACEFVPSIISSQLMASCAALSIVSGLLQKKRGRGEIGHEYGTFH